MGVDLVRVRPVPEQDCDPWEVAPEPDVVQGTEPVLVLGSVGVPLELQGLRLLYRRRPRCPRLASPLQAAGCVRCRRAASIENARWGCCSEFELSGLGDLLGGWVFFWGGAQPPNSLI